MSHTPGPWTYAPFPAAWPIQSQSGPVAQLALDEGAEDEHDEAVANARLIAAAPDEHDALLALVKILEGLEAEGLIDLSGDAANGDAEAYQAAKAAIVKATGGES